MVLAAVQTVGISGRFRLSDQMFSEQSVKHSSFPGIVEQDWCKLCILEAGSCSVNGQVRKLACGLRRGGAGMGDVGLSAGGPAAGG